MLLENDRRSTPTRERVCPPLHLARRALLEIPVTLDVDPVDRRPVGPRSSTRRPRSWTYRTAVLYQEDPGPLLTWKDLGDGYWELTGGLFGLHVVEIDEVAEREQDDLLSSFGHGKAKSLRARGFWVEQIGTKEAKMAMQDLEGYDEAVRRMLDLLPLEQRLAGLSPEQRLAGLSREQRLLAMSDEELRMLREEYLATFPEATREAVRKRIGG